MDALSNRDIGLALCKYSSTFLGVFSVDINPLPLIRSFPCCFVMNTMPHTERRGGHWLAFYLTNSNSIEFFDSLGGSLSSYPLISSYFSHVPNISSNSVSLQAPDSAQCGDYCISFLYLRLVTSSFRAAIEIIKSYSKGYSRESFVRKLRLLNMNK